MGNTLPDTNRKESDTHTRIKVSKKLTDKLKDIGGKRDTYEDIIWRLIEEVDQLTMMKVVVERQDEETIPFKKTEEQ